MRRGFAITMLCAAALMPTSSGVAAPAKPDYAKAYDLAVRCFVVSGWDDAHQHSRAAYDAAIKFGRAQGLTDRGVNDDFERAIATEGVKMTQHAEYRDQMLAACGKLGWAS